MKKKYIWYIKIVSYSIFFSQNITSSFVSYHIFLSVVLIQHFSFINLILFSIYYKMPNTLPAKNDTHNYPYRPIFFTIKLIQKFHLKMNPLNSINVCFTLLNITTSELVQEMVLLWQVSTDFLKQCWIRPWCMIMLLRDKWWKHKWEYLQL